MDQADRQLIRLLSENADRPVSELAKLVNLSVPSVNKRIARLKASGAIRKTTVITDSEAVGKPITAFVMVVLDHVSNAEALTDYAESDEDVLECYAVTGDYDYILKICAHDVESLEQKLLSLKKHRGVVKSHTMLALMEHKLAPTALPDT